MPFIAEFWNSLTSTAYIIPGIMHFLNLQQLKGSVYEDINFDSIHRIRAMTLSWVFLGFGSFLFHATQTCWGEFLDELGMISVSASTLCALREHHILTTGNIGDLFYFLYFSIMAVCMGLYIVSGSHPFFSFVFIASSLLSVFVLSTGPSEMSDIQARKMREGVIYALVGYGIWHIDQVCVSRDWIPSYEAYEWELQYLSHPVWHILTAMAGNSFISAVAFGVLRVDISSLHINAANKLLPNAPAVGIPIADSTSMS